MEIYGRPFSFGLENGFVLSDISHLLFVNGLCGACFLNWLGWKLVILDLLGEMFFVSIIDVIDLCDVLVYYQSHVKTWIVTSSSCK